MRWTQENPTEIEPLPGTEEPAAPGSARPSPDNSHVAKLNRLWDERRFIAKMVLLGLVCSAALSLVLPKRYESTVRLMPPDSSSESMALLSAVADKAGAFGGIASSLFGVRTSSDLLVGIVNSSTLQDRVIERNDLKNVYKLTYPEDLRNRLSDNTSIGVDRKSGITAITVTDRDPERAFRIAKSYVEELNVLTAQLSTSAARREREFLQDRLSEVSQDLEKAEKDLSQFSSKNATLNPQDQARAMVGAVGALQGQLIAAQAQLEGLRAIYTDNSVRVRALRAEIGRLQQEIERIGGKSAITGGSETADLLYPSIRQLPALGVAWTDLFRQAKIQEAVYEVLTKQYELAKVQEAKEIPSVKVLDPPSVPQKKSFPPRTVITIIGGFFAFCFAAVWVLAYARWQATDSDNPWKLFLQRVWYTVTSPLKKRLLRQDGWRIAGRVVFRHPDNNGKPKDS